MSLNYPLDAVIKKINSIQKPSSSAQRIVILDIEKGKIVQKPSKFFHRLLRLNLEYYLVSNSDDPSNFAESRTPTIRIRDFANDRTLEFEISYRASCNSGDEANLVLGLGMLNKQSHPTAALNKKIKTWVEEFSREKEAQIIDGFEQTIPRLSSVIVKNAYEEAGLILSLRIELKKPLSEKLHSIRIPVRVKDSNKELDVRSEIELQIDDEVKALVSNKNVTTLEEIVKSEIKGYLKEHVSMQQFHYELETGVRNGLIIHLNKIFCKEGRKVAHFAIESDFILQGEGVQRKPEELSEFEIQTKCDILEYPDPIIIKNKIQLKPHDIGKYIAACSPNLNDWSRAKLGHIIRELLFECKYIDMLTDFEVQEHEIKKRMEGEAERIGYLIKHLITVPDLKPLKLKEDFTLKPDATYETQQAGVMVKLIVVVTAKIPDLKKIEKYLNPKIEVMDLMEDVIRSKVQDLLHTISPERFYMRFSYSDKKEESPVEEMITSVISKALKKKFFAEVTNITPKVLDTKITERLKKLQGENCVFNVKLEPLGGTEEIELEGRFQIRGVDEDGWHTFQIKEYELPEIKNYLESEIKSKLETMDEGDLRYIDMDNRDQLLKSANNIAIDSMKTGFGLGVIITTIYRKRTKLEKSIAIAKEALEHEKIEGVHSRIRKIGDQRGITEKIAKEERSSELTQLEIINNQIESIVANEENEEEITELIKKAGKITKQIEQESLKTTEDELEMIINNMGRKSKNKLLPHHQDSNDSNEKIVDADQ